MPAPQQGIVFIQYESWYTLLNTGGSRSCSCMATLVPFPPIIPSQSFFPSIPSLTPSYIASNPSSPTLPSPSFRPQSSFFLCPLAPLVPLRVLGECCKFPSGVRGGLPATNAFLTIVTPENTSGDNRFINPTCILRQML